MNFLKKGKTTVFLFISWLLLAITPRVMSVIWRPQLKMETLIYDTHMRQYWEYAISYKEVIFPAEKISELLYHAQFFSVTFHSVYLGFTMILTAFLVLSLIVRYLSDIEL